MVESSDEEPVGLPVTEAASRAFDEDDEYDD